MRVTTDALQLTNDREQSAQNPECPTPNPDPLIPVCQFVIEGNATVRRVVPVAIRAFHTFAVAAAHAK
jgi:hypothetical protein